MSSLQQQLAALAQKAPKVAQLKRVSILFPEAEAKNIDTETIFGIGTNGYLELCRMDERFSSFETTLFSSSSITYNRQMHTKADNAKLDQSIGQFLCVLSPYLLLGAAHKALEYLIRRFNIQMYNVEDVLRAALPYHDTEIFCKLAKILKVDGTRWEWLAATKKQKNGVPRHVIVAEVKRELSILTFVADTCKRYVASSPSSTKALLCFYTAIALETISGMKRIDDRILHLLLPYVLEGLRSSTSADFQAASYMIIVQLAEHTTFSEDLASGLIVALSSTARRSVEDTVLVLLHLFQLQGHLQEIPAEALDHLLGQNYFVESLVELQAEFANQRFARLVMAAAVDSLPDDRAFAALKQLTSELELEAMSKDIITGLLQRYMTATKAEADRKSQLRYILRILEARYPKKLDQVLDGLLGDGSDTKELLSVLGEVLGSVRNMPLAEAGTTLFLSLQHASKHIRKSALETMCAQYDEHKEDEDFVKFYSASLAAALRDPKEQVVAAALAAPDAAVVIPEAELVATLTSVIVGGHGGAVKAAAMDLLFGSSAQKQPAMQQQGLMLLLRHCTHASQWATYRSVLLAHAGRFPLTKTLPAALKALKAADTKEQLQQGNQAVVEAVARALASSKNFASDLDALVGPLVSDSMPDVTKVADRSSVALILLAAMRFVKDTAQKLNLAEVLLQVLRPYARALHLSIQAEQVKAVLATPYGKRAYTEAGTILLCLHGISAALPAVNGPVDGGCWAKIYSVDGEVMNDGDRVFAILVTVFTFLAASPKLEALVDVLHVVLANVNLKGARVLRFLSFFWFVESRTPTDELVKVRALNLAAVAFASGKHGSDDASLFLPSVLVAMQDGSQFVRSAAYNCCSAIQEQVGSSSSKKRRKSSAGAGDSAAALFTEAHLKTMGKGASKLAAPTATNAVLAAILDDRNALLADPMHLSFATMAKVLAGKEGDDVAAYLGAHFLATNSLAAKEMLLQTLAQAKQVLVLDVASPELLRLLEGQEVAGGHLERILGLYLAQITAAKVAQWGKKAQETLLALLASDAVLLHVATQEAAREVTVAEAAAKTLTSEVFTALSPSHQEAVFGCLIRLLRATHPTTRAAVLEVCTNFELPSAYLHKELAAVDVDAGSSQAAKRQRRKSNEASASSTRATIDRLDSVLELMSAKRVRMEPESFFGLVKPAFALLRVLIDGSGHPISEEPTADYTIQLVLHVLSKLVTLLILLRSKSAEKAEADGDDVDMLDDTRVEAEDELLAEFVDTGIVVQCIRQSKSPQIHNKALLFLSSLATVFPERVLENIMPVFTFMGSSTMAQDDNYSFQVIQRTVQTIVPRIRHRRGPDAVLPLMRIFTDALPRIPSHRQLLLFTVFMNSLSTAQYHCMLLMLLTKASQSHEPVPDNVALDIPQFCASLCQKIPPSAVVECFTQLLATTGTLVTEPESEKVAALVKELPVAISDSTALADAVLRLVSEFLCTKDFVARILQLSASSEARLQARLVTFFDTAMALLHLLTAVHKRMPSDGEDDEQSERSRAGAVLVLVCDVIGEVNDLLSNDNFTQCIHQQLVHPEAELRRRALLILNDKINELDDDVDDETQLQFVGMVAPIVAMLKAEGAEKAASALNQQTAMFSLEILARHFAKGHPEPFLAALPVLLTLLDASSSHPQLLASTVICVATYCVQLGPKIIGHLPVIFPKIVGLLEQTLPTVVTRKGKVLPRESPVLQLEDPNSTLLLKVSCLSAVEVVVGSLAQFASPYLQALLETLLHEDLISSSASQVTEKVTCICRLLSDKLDARQLLPAIIASYKRAFSYGGPSLCHYFKLLAAVCRAIPRKQISDHYTRLFKFFAFAFDFRHQVLTKKKKLAAAERDLLLESVEKRIIGAFQAFVIRLDEQLFKPIFFKVLDWAFQAPADLYACRVTFFYRLVERLASHLKAIFVPYFAYMLDNAVEVVKDADSVLKEDSPSLLAKGLPDQALLNCIYALTRCFEHDTEQFVSKERFDTVVPPLVNLIEGRASSPRFGEVVKALVLCFGALVESLTNQKLWKPLQHLILIKTRSDRRSSRKAALLVLRELYKRQQQDFLILLPEAIPYIAERLEDSDEEVEGLCQDTVAEIDELLGDEKIEDYL